MINKLNGLDLIDQDTMFWNAQAAFEYLYKKINHRGITIGNTKCLLNKGFYILNPLDNLINTPFRKWHHGYAKFEWEWYKSGNRKVTKIKKVAKIWDKMHSGNDIVNSNYGYQWKRGDQLGYVIKELKRDPRSRRAHITIHDGKENAKHKFDTPCTLSIGFTTNVVSGRLDMSVMMRSNDLWFGFCNDQYCFSMLQRMIADELNIEVGKYFHFANNLHLYERHFEKLQ
jgi:thymidylate synthase